jgi:hypothetical protein
MQGAPVSWSALHRFIPFVSNGSQIKKNPPDKPCRWAHPLSVNQTFIPRIDQPSSADAGE